MQKLVNIKETINKTNTYDTPLHKTTHTPTELSHLLCL